MKKRYDVLATGWAIVILILCGIPGKKLPALSFLDWLRPDKIMHLVLFGVQCYLLLKAISGKVFSISAPLKILAVSATVFYGIAVEVMQHYVFIDRSGDFRDAIANALGAVAGLWLFNRFNIREKAN